LCFGFASPPWISLAPSLVPLAGGSTSIDLKPLNTSETPDLPDDESASASLDTRVQQPRLWRADGWTAQVLKNEDDDGWAVAMIKDGEPEPALIGPWTMGRDKKNPKPLDGPAFSTLVKTATEFVRRHEQQLHASLHQSIAVTAGAGRVTVCLDIVPDEDNPYAVLSAQDDGGELLAELRVAASFKLSRASAIAWADNQFKKLD
jgi:hypothetical protein